MAAIDIVQRLNPQVEFSREKLTEFLLHLRDLASLDASKVSSLFASVHPEVMKLSDLRDEWCRLSWWDIGSQLRVGVDMGRTLVKVCLFLVEMIRVFFDKLSTHHLASSFPLFFLDLWTRSCRSPYARRQRRRRYLDPNNRHDPIHVARQQPESDTRHAPRMPARVDSNGTTENGDAGSCCL